MRNYTLREVKRALRFHVKNNYRSKDSFTDDSVARFAKKMKCTRALVYQAMSDKSETRPNRKMLKEIGLKKASGYIKI